MPLPPNNRPWPPPRIAPIYDDMQEADVWYVGDKRALADYYGKAVKREKDRPSVEARLWAHPRALDEPERRVHVPVAGDIASASADLLYSEPPTLTVDDTATQTRLDKLVEDGGVISRLLESAELTAALGDGYLALAWDRDVALHPILTAWPGDAALPVWRYGHLVEVTFWRELAREGDTVVRLLERHAVENRQGLIQYGLYEGTGANLGKRVDLAAHDDAAHLAEITNADGIQPTSIDLLTAAHIPNMRPNRKHRGYHGRSDFAAPVYDLFDSIDQTMTSWMRDIRLGKGRITVPKGALVDLGQGQGSYFDPDREIYEEINMPPTDGQQITVSQFAIRVDEHRGTLAELLSSTARSCGYNASTFGLEEPGGAAITATEADDRKTRSTGTRNRKTMYQTPALRHILHAALALDRVQFNSGITPQAPTVEFPPATEPSEEVVARTLQMLSAADAISDYLKVKRQHPDWEESEISEEVDRLKADRTSDADPFAEVGATLAGNQLDDADERPPAEESTE